MALADLIARLEQDADSLVQAIRYQADADVRAIEAADTEALAVATAQHLDRRRAERQRALQHELAVRRRAARASELDARGAVFARILERARGMLAEAASSDAYRDALAGHLAEALSYLEGLPCRIRCAPSCEPVLRPLMAGHDDVALEIDDTLGPGLIAETLDGAVVVDNTLGARLARLERQLAVELMREVDCGLD